MNHNFRLLSIQAKQAIQAESANMQSRMNIMSFCWFQQGYEDRNSLLQNVIDTEPTKQFEASLTGTGNYTPDAQHSTPILF